MNKIKVNIPVEISICDENINSISFDNHNDFNVIFDTKNYTECVKFIISTITPLTPKCKKFQKKVYTLHSLHSLHRSLNRRAYLIESQFS